MAHITAPVDVVSGEILPLVIDASLALAEGDTATVGAKVMERTARKEVTGAIIGTPSLTGTDVAVTVDARELTSYNLYDLLTFLTVQPGQKVIAIVTPLECRY
jgi:hypothetical protein